MAITYTHTHTHTQTHTDACTHTHTYACTHTHTYTPIHMHRSCLLILQRVRRFCVGLSEYIMYRAFSQVLYCTGCSLPKMFLFKHSPMPPSNLRSIKLSWGPSDKTVTPASVQGTGCPSLFCAPHTAVLGLHSLRDGTTALPQIWERSGVAGRSSLLNKRMNEHMHVLHLPHFCSKPCNDSPLLSEENPGVFRGLWAPSHLPHEPLKPPPSLSLLFFLLQPHWPHCLPFFLHPQQ